MYYLHPHLKSKVLFKYIACFNDYNTSTTLYNTSTTLYNTSTTLYNTSTTLYNTSTTLDKNKYNYFQDILYT